MLNNLGKYTLLTLPLVAFDYIETFIGNRTVLLPFQSF